MQMPFVVFVFMFMYITHVCTHVSDIILDYVGDVASCGGGGPTVDGSSLASGSMLMVDGQLGGVDVMVIRDDVRVLAASITLPGYIWGIWQMGNISSSLHADMLTILVGLGCSFCRLALDLPGQCWL